MRQIAILCTLALCLALLAGCNPNAAASSSTSESSFTSTSITTTAVTTTTSQSTTEEPSASTTSTSEPEPEEPPASTTPLPQPVPGGMTVSFSGFGASSVLTLKNLRTDRAVQQIAFYEEDGVTYLFVTQRIGTDTYLSRCRVNTAQRTATLVDSAVLKGFGHGESMEVSIHNGKLYLFLGYSANPINDSSWAREVVRLRYDKGSITDQKVLKDFAYTTKDGKISFTNATPYRINFGLDDTADKIVFYTRCDTSNTGKTIKHRLTTYRLSDLHNALDTCSGTLSMKKLSSAYLASTGNVASADICKNGSFQGIEIDDKGVIWLTGGDTDTKPQLSVFKVSGSSITRSEVRDIAYMVSAKLGAQDFRKTTTYVEVECVKYYKGNYYCVFNPAGDLEMFFTEVYLLGTK